MSSPVGHVAFFRHFNPPSGDAIVALGEFLDFDPHPLRHDFRNATARTAYVMFMFTL